ncbi:hypothetical protein F3Y22_tig00110890pilonHSYRG00017 [Hibiscus syriacus]|uniref:Protein kinase domain-containing protein n=1 Tax=Hibiscus syriacus TaxID=106335 RepID=A0A6A2ZIM5_HIBSY|nr:hypothetical protein F3Y22_tig00110890pilonHSYRG00017 [Hibiscus syriacus]
MRRISTIVYYDGEIREDQIGVFFASNYSVRISFKRNITLGELITKISRKVQCVVRGMSLCSHYGLVQQVHQVDCPTQEMCKDFNLLMGNPHPGTIPSSSIGRHSSATCYDLHRGGSTNNLYDNIASSSRGMHSSSNFFELNMEMPSIQQSIQYPFDTMPTSSKGRHSNASFFDLNMEMLVTQHSTTSFKFKGNPYDTMPSSSRVNHSTTSLFDPNIGITEDGAEPESSQFNMGSDDEDVNEVPTNTVHTEPPAHMYEADYGAMYEPKFTNMPNVGDYGFNSSINDGADCDSFFSPMTPVRTKPTKWKQGPKIGTGVETRKQWVTEVQFLGVVEHPNLVKLIGYCAVDGERGIQRLLVYEFMQNKSLEDRLFHRVFAPLSWKTR